MRPGPLIHRLPSTPVGVSTPPSSRIDSSMPGSGLPTEPMTISPDGRVERDEAGFGGAVALIDLPAGEGGELLLELQRDLVAAAAAEAKRSEILAAGVAVADDGEERRRDHAEDGRPLATEEREHAIAVIASGDEQASPRRRAPRTRT